MLEGVPLSYAYSCLAQDAGEGSNCDHPMIRDYCSDYLASRCPYKLDVATLLAVLGKPDSLQPTFYFPVGELPAAPISTSSERIWGCSVGVGGSK